MAIRWKQRTGWSIKIWGHACHLSIRKSSTTTKWSSTSIAKHTPLLTTTWQVQLPTTKHLDCRRTYARITRQQKMKSMQVPHVSKLMTRLTSRCCPWLCRWWACLMFWLLDFRSSKLVLKHIMQIIEDYNLPVVPYKAEAEVSKIGNL